jgi:hypothetical protein
MAKGRPGIATVQLLVPTLYPARASGLDLEVASASGAGAAAEGIRVAGSHFSAAMTSRALAFSSCGAHIDGRG